jgi:hypothetical protein
LTEVIEPWKAMHVAEREVKLLEAMRILHQSDTFLGEERRSAYNSERRLVPEITLKNLAGDDGQGFLTLINALLPDPDRVDQYRIVRNAEFEAHYGINFESDETIMPPSQSERAYQETRLHLRHLYLLEFVRVIVARLVSPSLFCNLRYPDSQLAILSSTTVRLDCDTLVWVTEWSYPSIATSMPSAAGTVALMLAWHSPLVSPASLTALVTFANNLYLQ